MHPYITDEDENIITNQLYLTDHRNSRHYYVFLCLFKRQSTEFNVFGIRNINYLQHGAGIGFVSLKSCRINCIKYLFVFCFVASLLLKLCVFVLEIMRLGFFLAFLFLAFCCVFVFCVCARLRFYASSFSEICVFVRQQKRK